MTLEAIRDVSEHLVTCLASEGSWRKNPLSHLVSFGDDWTRERIGDLCARYLEYFQYAFSGKPLSLAKFEGHLPENSVVINRSIGVAILESLKNANEYNESFSYYKEHGYLDPCFLFGSQGTPIVFSNPLFVFTEAQGALTQVHRATFPLDAFETDSATTCLLNFKHLSTFSDFVPPERDQVIQVQISVCLEKICEWAFLIHSNIDSAGFEMVMIFFDAVELLQALVFAKTTNSDDEIVVS
jgi:hypothetical protein